MHEEYIARTSKYYKDCSSVKLVKITPFLVFPTSSFLSEVCTRRIFFICLYQNRTGYALSTIISVFKIGVLVFLLK